MKKKLGSIKKHLVIAKKSIVLALKISKWPTIMMFIFIIFVSLLPFGISWIDNKIIDALIEASRTSLLGNLVAFFIVGVILRIALQIMWSLVNYVEKIQYFDVNKYMNLETLKKLSGLDIEFYEDPKTNDLIQRVRDSYDWRPSDYITNLFWTMRDIIGIITSATIIMAFSFWVFALIFVLTIPVIYVKIKYGKGVWTLHDANINTRRAYWDIASQLSHEFSIFDLKVYKTRNYLLDHLKKLFTDFQNKEKKIWVKRSLTEGLLGIVSNLGVIIGEIVVISKVLLQEITIGQFSFYSRTFLSFAESLGSFFHRFGWVYENGLFMEDIFKFFELPAKIKDGETVLNVTKAPSIEIRNLRFTYPDTKAEIFKGLNLKIESGEHIAIVGENGAGKSTLVKLLSRFYLPSKGEILIDGNSLSELRIESWYKYLAAVFQDIVIYSAFDIKTNIGLGRISKINDKERLEKAVNLARAKSVIESKELGYEQKLSKRYEGGIELSGGEKQRIALARAFFRDAPVVILDEPTSAIDAKAEAEIFDNLFETFKNKTVIIISHRFSTVRNADRILVMDKGKIAEEGSHEVLLEKDGLYAKMFNIQARGYK